MGIMEWKSPESCHVVRYKYMQNMGTHLFSKSQTIPNNSLTQKCKSQGTYVSKSLCDCVHPLTHLNTTHTHTDNRQTQTTDRSQTYTLTNTVHWYFHRCCMTHSLHIEHQHTRRSSPRSSLYQPPSKVWVQTHHPSTLRWKSLQPSVTKVTTEDPRKNELLISSSSWELVTGC